MGKGKLLGIKIGDKVIECQQESDIEVESVDGTIVTDKGKYSFRDITSQLGIEDYTKDIWNAHPTEELFYIDDYVTLANHFKETEGFSEFFREWFTKMVDRNPNKLTAFFIEAPRLFQDFLNQDVADKQKSPN